MATNFKGASQGPAHLSSEPQKELAPERALVPGLEHRPFSDDEIKQAFETFDLDHNRFVGAMEIRHILEVIGEEVTDEEIDEMIRMCDTDGDGQVTFEEFSKLMTQPAPPRPPTPPAAPMKYSRRQVGPGGTHGPQTMLASPLAPGGGIAADIPAPNKQLRLVSVETMVRKLSGGMDKIKPSQIKRIYNRFQTIDQDKSGSIEYGEFIQALEIEDNTTSQQMFRVFDMDRSGSIELKEFIVMLSRYTSANKTDKLKFAFMMFDEDASNYIERAELKAMLQANFIVEGFTEDELEDRANQVFDFLELPRDGKISYDDFLKLSSSENGLIYPVSAEQKMMPANSSMNRAYDEDD